MAYEQQSPPVYFAQRFYQVQVCEADFYLNNDLRGCDGHRVRFGGGFLRRRPRLWHTDKFRARLARLDWQHFGLRNCVFMDANCQQVYIRKARNVRHLFSRGVCDFDVFQGNARIEYSSVVPAVNLPWRGVCVPKHNVYGFAARLYGFSAFFPRTDGFQRFAYGNRRLHRLRVLLQRSQLLRCRGGKKFFGLRRKNLYVYGRQNALRMGGVCVHRIAFRLLVV